MYGTASGAPVPDVKDRHFLARDAIEGDVVRARNWQTPDACCIEAAPHSRVLAQLLDGCNDQGQHRLRGGGVLVSNVGRNGAQIAGARGAKITFGHLIYRAVNEKIANILKQVWELPFDT